MTEREEGYRQGIADAEQVCKMIAESWTQNSRSWPDNRAHIAKLVADTIALAGKSIRDLEPGFISPKE